MGHEAGAAGETDGGGKGLSDGVSISFLLDFASKVPAGYTTADVVNRIIRPFTAQRTCSYAELLPQRSNGLTAEAAQRGPAQYVVVHHWNLDFKTQFMSLIQQYIQQQHGSTPPASGQKPGSRPGSSAARPVSAAPPIYLWIDIFSMNLHDTEGDPDPDGAAGTSAQASGGAMSPRSFPLHGPPSSGLPYLRQAVLSTVAGTALSSQPPLPGAVAEPGGASSTPPPPQSAAGTSKPAKGNGAAGAKAPPAAPVPLLLLLDPNCSPLTSAYCLYPLWLRARINQIQHRIKHPHESPVSARSGSRPATHRGASAPGARPMSAKATAAAAAAAELTAAAAGHGVVPLVAAGQDLLVTQLVWDQMGPARPSEHTPEVAHSAILAEVTAAAEEDVAECHSPLRRNASSMGRSVTGGGGAGAGQLSLPHTEPRTPEDMATVLLQLAITGALQARVDVLQAAAAASAAGTEARLALSHACDALGCVLLASGRYADAEPPMRRAVELRIGAFGASHPLTAAASLHLGALLALGGGPAAEEAGQLLRSAVEQLDAAAGVAAAAAGAPASAAAALTAAQGRYYLAVMLAARAASGGGGLARNASTASSAGGAPQASPRRQGGDKATGLPAPRGGGGPRAAGEVSALLAAALPAVEAAYGAEHPITATLLSNQAMALKDLNRLDEAEPLLRRALAIREAALGPMHLDTMRSLNNLAGLVEAQGHLEESEALLRRTAELAAGSLGPSHPATATSLSNLGVVLRKQGKLEEAEELFTAALEIREKLLGPSHLDTAASLGDMTLLLLDQGRLAEAEPLFRRILDIRELVLGPSHADTAASLVDLASLLAQMDRANDAETLLRRAVTIYTTSRGEQHADTATSVRELAKLLAKQGKMDEAEEQYRAALGVMEASLGPSHLQTAITTNQLALLLKDKGELEEAEELFRKVLATADAQEEAEKRAAEARATAAAAAAEGGQVGPTSPDATGGGEGCGDASGGGGGGNLAASSMVAMRSLADILVIQNNFEEAETLTCRALVLAEGALGGTHPLTLSTAEALADILIEQGLLEDAAELYAQLVEAVAEEQGEEGEDVVKYLGLYEEVYHQLEAKVAAQQQAAPSSHASAATSATGAGAGALSVEGGQRSHTGPSSVTAAQLRALANANAPLLAKQGSRGRRPRADGGDAASDAGTSLVHHSFASFVSRRSGTSRAAAAAGAGALVRSSSQSVTSRAQSRLQALTGRVGSLTGSAAGAASRFRPGVGAPSRLSNPGNLVLGGAAAAMAARGVSGSGAGAGTGVGPGGVGPSLLMIPDLASAPEHARSPLAATPVMVGASGKKFQEGGEGGGDASGGADPLSASRKSRTVSGNVVAVGAAANGGEKGGVAGGKPGSVSRGGSLSAEGGAAAAAARRSSDGGGRRTSSRPPTYVEDEEEAFVDSGSCCGLFGGGEGRVKQRQVQTRGRSRTGRG